MRGLHDLKIFDAHFEFDVVFTARELCCDPVIKRVDDGGSSMNGAIRVPETTGRFDSPMRPARSLRP